MVDYNGLENRRTERYRGFESLSLRKSLLKEISEGFFHLYIRINNLSILLDDLTEVNYKKLMFSKKTSLKIWWNQKIVVPLHPLKKTKL